MAYPRRSSRTPRSRFTLALLLLTAVTVLVLDLPGTGPLDPVRNVVAAAFRPVRAAGNAVFEPLSNGWKGAFGYGDLEDENARLRGELDERDGLEAEVERLEQDNAELRKLQNLEVADERTKAAKVVSGPITSFEQTVEIDAGTSGGVRRGMAVVTGGGILGRVADAKGSSATVDLLTSPSVRIGISTKSGDIGLAQGQGRGRPLLITLDRDVRLSKGDFVYTAGIDRTAIPGDVSVGKISKVTEAADGAPRVIELEPTADLGSRYVRVVLREAPR